MNTKEGSQIWDWRWPETGRNQEALSKVVRDIVSPYEELIPPFCYPGTPLSGDLLSLAGPLLQHHINAIGSHTHGEMTDKEWHFRKGEGGFERIQRMEAQVIWMIASMIGGTRESVDGYFCGGGTEANLQGLWVGRQWLRQHPDPYHKGITVLSSGACHYSIVKAVEILDLGHHEYIPCHKCSKPHLLATDPKGNGLTVIDMDDAGQLCLESIEEVFHKKYELGFRQFLVVPTVGTYITGSIDPISEIGAFADQMSHKTGAHFYIHIDASFAGFTVPFVNPDAEIGFTVPQVHSMTLDADKMGRLPYPAGIFLCRKDLMHLVARKVRYVRGNEDDTVSGSRSSLAQVLGWYLYQSEGIDGQRAYVRRCLDARDQLVKLIQVQLPWVRVLPYSPWVNFAPMVIDIEDGAVPEALCEEGGLLAPYHLRSDFLSVRGECPQVVYKICVMPHTIPHLQRFVRDLKKAKESWGKKLV